MSEWSHLANAEHIDLIIAHVKANPTAWRWPARVAAWDEAWYSAWDAAYEAAVLMARKAARAAAFEAVYDAAYDAVRAAAEPAVAYDTLLALVAWDYAGGLMDLPAEQVKVLAILGDRAAILMYSAIKAMETTQELA